MGMKQVHTSASETEAQNLRQYLTANGIEATVHEELQPRPASDLPPLSSWRVVVHDDDYDDALAEAARFDLQPAQTVADVDEPSLVVHPRSDRKLWVQLAFVLVLTQPFYSPIGLLLWKKFGSMFNWSFNFSLGFELCFEMFAVAVVLIAVRVSGERWSTYGLKRPTFSVDIITGGIAFACSIAAALVGKDLCKTLLTDLLGKPYEPPRNYAYWMDAPRDTLGLFAMLILAIAIALSEELTARGYLIPTLERLLKSTPLSVLVAAAYFGMCHFRLGLVNVSWCFCIGLVYGVFFVWTRRLWPLVFAHALTDFSIFIQPPR
jgi:membrane protease YdiL (CAAX protease family)